MLGIISCSWGGAVPIATAGPRVQSRLYRVEMRKTPQQQRLADAARTTDKEDLAGGDCKAEVLQDGPIVHHALQMLDGEGAAFGWGAAKLGHGLPVTMRW